MRVGGMQRRHNAKLQTIFMRVLRDKGKKKYLHCKAPRSKLGDSLWASLRRASKSMTSIAGAKHKHSYLPTTLEPTSNAKGDRGPCRDNSCLASIWALQRVRTWPSACEAPFKEVMPQHARRHLAWGHMSAGQQSYRTHTACMWGLVKHLKGRLGKPDLGHSIQSALRLSAGHTLQ